MSSKKYKLFGLLLPILTVILFLGIEKIDLSYATQDYGAEDPEVREYLEGLEYIVISGISLPNRGISDPYMGMYAEIPAEEQEDYSHRMEYSVFTSLLYPDGFKEENGSVEEHIKTSISERLAENRFRNLPIILFGSKEYRTLRKKGQLKDKNKSLWIEVRVGQQRMLLDGKDVLAGAIGATINVHYYGPHFYLLANPIVPEPFIYDPETGNRASYNRALDFLALQLTKYLNFLGSIYQ